MSAVLFLLFILFHVTEVSFSVKYDIEETICNLCHQRKVCHQRLCTSPFEDSDTVLFTASFSKHTYISPRQTFVMDKVSINRGDMYHSDTGMFISEREGIYLFSWSILKRFGSKFSVNLVHNGKSTAISYSGVSGFDQLSASIALPLKSGDKVWLVGGGHNKAHIHRAEYCFFSAVEL